MKLRLEYWEKVKDIQQKNLVFLDETGVLLGLSRTHARSQLGTRAYAVKPFYRGKKFTVIGAISFQRVVALMTIDNSMDSQAFEVFIEKCLVPQLWSGAVVVMDNLPAHKGEHPSLAASINTQRLSRQVDGTIDRKQINYYHPKSI